MKFPNKPITEILNPKKTFLFKSLSKLLLRNRANEQGNHTTDFTVNMVAFYGLYGERKKAHGSCLCLCVTKKSAVKLPTKNRKTLIK
ncbi:hypothetical protein NLX74_22740 [Paenibacillus sp. MZ03-122A]|nr:hypothetical protein [Paenibacillus sp. MZ03-122A]